MLFKLSVSNIRRSMRDYAIYFFTLIIGVSIFYMFNAVGGQAAMLRISESRSNILELLTNTLSGVSVFVAAVLGLLIVYASRFLMKRRGREFALYLTLGMEKGKISAILLLETLLIGLGSLAAGLVVGIGISQFMSAFVANLFEADMTAWQFSVSVEAILKTILCFTVMYLIVMIFNSASVSRMKLIDLMQSGRKSERIRLKNPVICAAVFLAAAAMLGYAYYKVAYVVADIQILDAMLNADKEFLLYIVMGAAATFLILWSVSGMLLWVVRSMKGTYYRGLNSFTFRQISNQVNTTVISMTVICLMLFVTICALSAALTIRNSMNANLQELCPADIEIDYADNDEAWPANCRTILSIYQDYGYDLTEYLGEHVDFYSYWVGGLEFWNTLDSYMEEFSEQYGYLGSGSSYTVVRLSDYNALMQLYGREQLSLEEDEYILVCNIESLKTVIDAGLRAGITIQLSGHTLKPKYEKCQDGFIEISSQPLNDGLFIVPDDVIGESSSVTGATEHVIGNYSVGTQEGKSEAEQFLLSMYREIREQMFADMEQGFSITLNTKIDIADATIGVGAIATFLGLYIGLVFLIACGVILALKTLSESVDSIWRYEMLRKIGAEERDISQSLFRQVAIFFLLPMILAVIHSFFGMKFAMVYLELFGTSKMMVSILSTSAMVLLIYGGYFLITWFCSRGIIRNRDN